MPNLEKPIFSVDIAKGSHSPLASHLVLTRASDEGCFHTANGLRQPLGIYNVSVSRVCDKVVRLCQRLEAYFAAEDTLGPDAKNDNVMQELIDYMELLLYAAAEHVDDLDSIATGYFRNTSQRDKHPAYRELAKTVKHHKRFIASAANAIKHQQSRIRVFSMEFAHGGHIGILHGYFIEGVDQGVVCPSRIFHKTQDVFSITTLAWEVLLFVLYCSDELSSFLVNVAKQHEGPFKNEFDQFALAVVAAARLPLYTFGEDHPFAKAALRVHASDGSTDPGESGLYGSIRSGWSRTSAASFGRHTSRFEGDSKSRQFRFAQPKSVALQYWD